MKAVVQRAARGSVTIDGKITGRIGRGFVVLLGIRTGDTEENARYLARKTANLRIFADENGRMNLSIMDIHGEILVVSQFTLYAATEKGNRPSFLEAAEPDRASPLYETYVKTLQTLLGEGRVATGSFGADMEVEIINDGPVTIQLSTDGK